MVSIRNILAFILLVTFLCISTVGCAETQATTNPTKLLPVRYIFYGGYANSICHFRSEIIGWGIDFSTV